MPDWPIFVKDRLGPLGLDAGREAEIVAELAGHYEDLVEEGLRTGRPGEGATLRALEEVRDWDKFRHEIRSAELGEDEMNHRTKSIWLPGLVTSMLYWGMFWVLETLGVRVKILWMTQPPLMFSLAWTLLLPLVGALGALTSRQLGGRSGDLLLAGLFPAAFMGAFFTALFPFAMLVDFYVPKSLQLYGYAAAMLGWSIIPGTALLVGVLPFVLTRRHRPSVAPA